MKTTANQSQFKGKASRKGRKSNGVRASKASKESKASSRTKDNQRTHTSSRSKRLAREDYLKKLSMPPGTMLSPVPAALVSLGSMEESNLVTVGWCGIVNTNPPMTYISLRESRYSYEIIKNTKEFAINLTNEDLAFATDFSGVRSGRDLDKFNHLGLTKIKGEKISCPLVGEAPLSLECRVVEDIPLGSHHMLLSQIVNVQVSQCLMDDKNRLDLSLADLICYCHGHYYKVDNKPIGRFGFSVMKEKTKKRQGKRR